MKNIILSLSFVFLLGCSKSSYIQREPNSTEPINNELVNLVKSYDVELYNKSNSKLKKSKLREILSKKIIQKRWINEIEEKAIIESIIKMLDDNKIIPNELIFLLGEINSKKSKLLLDQLAKNDEILNNGILKLTLGKIYSSTLGYKIVAENKINLPKSMAKNATSDEFGILYTNFYKLLYLHNSFALTEVLKILKDNRLYHKYYHTTSDLVSIRNIFAMELISTFKDNFLRQYFTNKYGSWTSIETIGTQDDMLIIDKWVRENLNNIEFQMIIVPIEYYN